MTRITYSRGASLVSFAVACSFNTAMLLVCAPRTARAQDPILNAISLPSKQGMKTGDGAQASRVASVDGPMLAQPLAFNIPAAEAALVSSGGRAGQVGAVAGLSPFPLSVRLGALISPRTKFDGGIDATIRGLHIIPQLNTRADVDVITSVNFGGITTLVPLTIDQIYPISIPGGTRLYVGGGIGPYFSNVTRFGGKVFFGVTVGRIGGEATVHFAGQGEALVALQARIGI